MTQQTQIKQIPKGWKEKPLSEVLDYEQPNPYIIKGKIKSEGKIPVLTPNKSFIKGYSDEKEGIYSNIPTIIFDDFTADNKFVNFPFKVKSSAMKILNKKDEENDLKFIFYQMQIQKVNTTTHKRYYLSNYQNLKFLFPPLPEQTLIVQEIEKQFTRLDAAVKSLKAVKQKLEIYRKAVLKKAFEGELIKNINYNKNKLIKDIEDFNNKKTGQDKTRRLPGLSFDDLKNIPSNWFFINAHKVCSSVRDGTHDSPKYVEEGFPLVTSKNLKNGKLDFSKIDFISQKDYEEIKKRSQVDIGDILFAMIGTTGNPVEIKEEPKFAIKNVGLFKNKEQRFLLTPYLKHWLDSPNYFKILESKKLIKGTTQKFIDLGTLRISPVPVCSKEEQTQIVQEIESKFSVIDKIEQVINESLEKSEKLRKSILKSAFEGKLVKMEEAGE